MIRKAERDWLTASEVAEMIGHSDTQAIYRWIREGILPASDFRRAGKKKPRYRVSRVVAERLRDRLVSGLTGGA